jgi:hypothetical protein
MEVGDPMVVLWPGFTMHGLVRWRAGVEFAQEEYQLVAASCRTSNEYEAGIDFRLALWQYLPDASDTWRLKGFTPKGYAYLSSSFGTTFLSYRDVIMAKHLLTKAYNLQRRILGERDSATIQTEVQLLRVTFFKKGKASGERDEQSIGAYREENRRRVLRTMETPEGRVRVASVLFDFDREKPRLWHILRYFNLYCSLGVGVSVASDRSLIACIELIHQAALEETQSRRATILVDALQLDRNQLGSDHGAVIRLIFNLARAHFYVGNRESEKKYLQDAIHSMQRTLGKEHPSTLQLIGTFAFSRLYSKDFDTVTDTMEDLWEVSRRILGDDDPRTRWRGRRLELFLSLQSRMRMPDADQEVSLDAERLSHWLRITFKAYERGRQNEDSESLWWDVSESMNLSP